jgi:hypothetical protein
MTRDEHRARHKALHEAYDELLADYLHWHPTASPHAITALEVLLWSFYQTIEPAQEAGGDTNHVYAVCATCGGLIPDQGWHVCFTEGLIQ